MVKQFVFKDDVHFYGKPCRVCGGTVRYQKGVKQCVACKLRIRREQYQANAEEEKRTARQWQLDNPEAYQAIRDRFEASNPEYHAEWQRQNPDKVAIYTKRYYDANREEILAKARAKKQQLEQSTVLPL